MPHLEATSHKHREHQPQTRSIDFAGMILLIATINISCWLLVGSIGWATSPQPLADDATTLALIFLWLTQIATGGFLMAMVAPSLAVSSTAVIIGATTVAICRTLLASGGNGAVWSFWVAAGAYMGLAVEAVFEVLQMVEDRLARHVEGNALTRMR